ncbi:amidohydrolase family protein [Amycolatopsis taiwanensis]|uniref:amidohydrolase family protein n=1 Tax=Amycolatopsis taiwanensis TaxID=342230 RepID=UPI0025539659|nr:amidohydrolase family protein [Amycolatopsis taiwanensis]
MGATVKVDAHHHLWDVTAREHAWLDTPSMAPIRKTFTVADLEMEARAAGIERTVLVQVLPSVDETREFLSVAQQTPLIAGVVGWVDLTRPDVADTLAELTEPAGLVGIRHLVQGEPDPDWLNRPDVRRGLRAVADAGLRFDLLTLPHQLPAAIDTVRALPELTFVLDHLSKPPIASGRLDPWARLFRELAAEPNVVAKLSGLVTEAGPGWEIATLRSYTELAMEAFGPGRLMFGSDWPVCLLAAGYSAWAEAAFELTGELSPAERAEVFGGTATRVYQLDLHS